MQVTAISAAFTGSQKKTQTNPYNGDKPSQHSFEEFLLIPNAPDVTEDEINATLKRAMQRMEVLVGSEMAESVVNADGTINLARYAQVMGAATRPYGATNRNSYASTPQVVDLVA